MVIKQKNKHYIMEYFHFKTFKTLVFLTIFLVILSGKLFSSWTFLIFLFTSLSNLENELCFAVSRSTTVNQGGSSSPACQPPDDNYCTRLCQTKDAYCVDEKTCVCHPGGLPPVVPHPNQPTYNNRLFVCDPDSCRRVCAPKGGQCNEDGECQCFPG